ncbi:hypothetical protein TBC1_111569 [Lentimicrobium saccharophilum]|uniref:Uncharacterized protein n=1 Tax=Lentimicrobium saccharophilum TaxID=1678841 RepID=A0A0S7C301_9BACT|nr:hypothetical protein TBC1_111569 [Lentimicrobium saccharophilum]
MIYNQAIASRPATFAGSLQLVPLRRGPCGILKFTDYFFSEILLFSVLHQLQQRNSVIAEKIATHHNDGLF